VSPALKHQSRMAQKPGAGGILFGTATCRRQMVNGGFPLSHPRKLSPLSTRAVAGPQPPCATRRKIRGFTLRPDRQANFLQRRVIHPIDATLTVDTICCVRWVCFDTILRSWLGHYLAVFRQILLKSRRRRDRLRRRIWDLGYGRSRLTTKLGPGPR